VASLVKNLKSLTIVKIKQITRICMMIKNLMLSTLIFFIALPVFAADSIKSLPFKEKSISKAEIRSICQQIKLSCD